MMVHPEEFSHYFMSALFTALSQMAGPRVKFCLSGLNLLVEQEVRLGSGLKVESFSGQIQYMSSLMVDYILSQVCILLTPLTHSLTHEEEEEEPFS